MSVLKVINFNKLLYILSVGNKDINKPLNEMSQTHVACFIKNVNQILKFNVVRIN